MALLLNITQGFLFFVWSKYGLPLFVVCYNTTTANTFRSDNNKLHLFTGKELLNRLWLAASSIGADTLGLTADQIGLHSARNGAAMAMYLAGVPVFTIMLLDQWFSDAFMHYIRKQVKELSSRISSRMIQHKKIFNIPSEPLDEPRSLNRSLNLSSRKIWASTPEKQFNL